MYKKYSKTHVSLVLSAIAIATLVACGTGSTDTPAEESSAKAAATSTSTEATKTEAATVAGNSAEAAKEIPYEVKKVMFLGATSGFVATKLAAALPAGTQEDYQILVVGDADKLSETELATVKQALASGKEVVFDGASDGSNRSTHAAVLGDVIGTSIDSAAVSVQKHPEKGYGVTPIDLPTVSLQSSVSAQSGISAQNAKSATVSSGETISNSVDNIFGISTSGSAK